MKRKIIKMCASSGRQPLKQLLNRERCSWKTWAVKKNQKKRMRRHSKRVCEAGLLLWSQLWVVTLVPLAFLWMLNDTAST